MFIKRIILTLCTFAVLLPLAGCRHRCCHKEVISSAPPCCPSPAPGGFLPPPPVQ